MSPSDFMEIMDFACFVILVASVSDVKSLQHVLK